VDKWKAISEWKDVGYFVGRLDTFRNARVGRHSLFIGQSGKKGLLDTSLLHDPYEKGRDYRTLNISLSAFIEKVSYFLGDLFVKSLLSRPIQRTNITITAALLSGGKTRSFKKTYSLSTISFSIKNSLLPTYGWDIRASPPNATTTVLISQSLSPPFILFW